MTQLNIKSMLFYICLLFLQLYNPQMDFKVLDWQSANELKLSKAGKPFQQITFNLANVFLLDDSSYLVMPPNPFGNSVWTKKRDLIDQWILDEKFPTVDHETGLYSKHKSQLDSLDVVENLIVDELIQHLERQNLRSKDFNSVDNVCELLKKKKVFAKYKLNFLVFAARTLMKEAGVEQWKWGLLKRKQFLNNQISVVIVLGHEANLYYDVEEEFFGKWGFLGLNYLSKTFDSKLKRQDISHEVFKVF